MIFTCVIPAIIVSITDPDSGNAFIIVALVLIFRTNFWRTFDLVLTSRAINLMITFLVSGNAETGNGGIALALELFAQTCVVVAIL